MQAPPVYPALSPFRTAVVACADRKTYPYSVRTMRKRVIRYANARPSQMSRVRAIQKDYTLKAPSRALRDGLCTYVLVMKEAPSKKSGAHPFRLKARPKRSAKRRAAPKCKTGQRCGRVCIPAARKCRR